MALTCGSFDGYEVSRMVLLFARAVCRPERHQQRFSKIDGAD
jgi:hypothetical protein